MSTEHAASTRIDATATRLQPHSGHSDEGHHAARASFLSFAASMAMRRRLSLLAFLLGIAAVVLSVTTVIGTLLQNREAAQTRYLQSARNQVRMLVHMIEVSKEKPAEETLNAMYELWSTSGRTARDEHLLIIDNLDSSILFDNTIKLGEGKSPALNDAILALREQMQFRDLYTGAFRSGQDEWQIGSFLQVSPPTRRAGRNWLVGIFRSRDGLDESLFKAGSLGTLILVCGLAMPCSLLLMYYTYYLAQRAQVRAEEARSRLAAIVESSDDAIFSQTPDGVITSWNRGAEQIFGYSEAEAVGRRSDDIIPSDHADDELETVGQIDRGESRTAHVLEAVRRTKGGRRVCVSQTISPVRDEDGGPAGISINARDITARKDLEREVLEITSQEQQRIGRELHDSLGQELTGLGYLAKTLSQQLAATHNPHGETAQTITSGIQRAIGEVRSAVKGLVPVELDASAFMVAVEKLAADTRSRCGIECRVESFSPIKIDDNVVATHLYRIVQEAVNNAVKHAQAREIVVRPISSNGTLKVIIQDDGRGIRAEVPREGGMGLRIMRYRAGVIDASLEVHPRDGGGTDVVCKLKKKGPEHEASRRR